MTREESLKIIRRATGGNTPAANEPSQTVQDNKQQQSSGARSREESLRIIQNAIGGGSTAGASPQEATPQSAAPTAPLTQGSLAGEGRSAEQGTQASTAAKAQMTQSEAQAELDRLKPVLEEAKQYENEIGRYVSGAGRDPALYHSTLKRRDSLLKKYGYSSVDELNKAVMDYTLASGNKLSLMQKLDRAGSAMEEGLKNTVLSGDWWKNLVLGGAEQWTGSQLNAAGTTAGNIESIGKEGAGMVYENELRARNDWATTLEEAKSGVIKMDAEGIAEIEKILDYYDNTLLPSLRSGVQAYETLAEDSAAAADEITTKGQQNTEKAKEGLGWGGQLAVDLLTQGTMIALDKATGAPNISMFTRGLGSGAQEARQDGGSAQKQIGYGAAVGTVEVLTNKLFDGLAGIYGKGAADDLVEATIAKLAKSRDGQAALRLLASGFNEGIEEILSDAVNPLLRTIYSDKSIKEEYSEEQLSQWLYDGLVGGIMGTGLTAVNPETYSFNPGKPQTSGEVKPGAETQAAGTTVAEATPQSALQTAPLAEEPLRGTQTQVAETAQNAQRSTSQAETPPITANAVQEASDALNSHETHNGDVVDSYDATNKQALRAALEFIRIAEDSGVSPDDAYQFLSLEQQMALDKYNSSREAPNSRFSFDEFYRSYDWKAARERASAAYDNAVKRWYIEHPGANEIDPDSILVDRTRFINQYIRNHYKIDANNAFNAFKQSAAMQKTFEEDHSNGNSYNPEHSSLNDIRRVDDAYEDELDKYGEPKRYESRYDNDIAGNFVGTEAKVAGRKRSWLSDEDAPPESRSERYYDDQLRMESRRKFREDEERRKKYKIGPPTAWGKQQMGVYTKPSSESDSTKLNLSAEEKQNHLGGTSSLNDAIDGISKSDAQPESHAVTDERGNYAQFSYGEDDGLSPVVPNSGQSDIVSEEALKARFYSGLSENRDKNGVRKSYHSSAIIYAEHTFGNQLDSIQESTKRVTDTDTSKLNKYTQEQVLRLKSMMDDVAHGCAEMKDLLDTYRSMGDSTFMADFYNESAMNMLDRACNELREAYSSSTPYAVNRFRWDAEKAFAMMSKSFERGNQAIADKAAFSKAALENLKPAKLGSNGKERLDVPGWYKIFQTSAPNMFRSIDGWKNKGGIGYQLADQAEQCFVNQTKEQAAGEDFFAGIEKTDGFDKFLKGGKSVSISVGEKTYSMNEQEAVSLLKAVKTIYASGGKARSEALSGLRIGEKTIVFPDNFNMFSLFSQIDSQLSKAGRAYMNAFDGMLSYYSGRLKETSSEVYGFGKGMYSRGDYMPLRYSTADGKISSTSIQQDAANGYDTMRIMQERGATHGGYLLVEPVTIVAERYMRNASDYIAYSAFAERMAGLNRSTENGDGAADILRKYYGKNGSQWMDRYASRVSQLYTHKETSTFDDVLKKLRMNLYQGALGMSVTVPMKQYASYWSAADVLGIGTLLEARAKYFGNKGDSLENSVMRSRRRGSIDPTYSDILHSDETMIGRMKKNSKFVRWLADGISRTDAKVFDSMYFACELAVKKENPKIDLNSKEYRKKVDDKFNQIAMRTQSIFAPTISADMQMTDNEFLKTISVFRTQQTQDFNRVLKAVGEYQNAEGSAKKEAGKVLANSISGSVIGSISLGVMTSVARLMLHKKRDYEDEEGNFDAGLLMRNIAFDSIKSLAGIAWFGDELASYALSVITKGDEKYYGLPMGGIDSISDVMDSISNFSENPSVYNAKQTAMKLTTLLGIPANNVYSMLNSVVMYSIDAVGGNDGRYDDIIKWLHNESGGNIRDFSAEGVEFDLSAIERKSYKTVQDKARNKLTTDYATQPGVALLDDDQQENVMEAIESYATAKAKQTILDARNSDAELNRDSWQELPENQIAGFLVAREQAKALYDNDGNINSYADMDRYLRSYYSKLTVKQKEMLSNSSNLSRLDDLYNAQRAGIDSKTYSAAYQLYRKYDSAKGNGTARAEDLKTEISKLGLTSIQTAWLEKNLQLYRITPIETDTYDKLVSAGISNDSANRLQDDMRSLPVLDGHSGIIDNQKYRAIMEANYLSEDDKWKAFEAIATEAALREANANRAIGLSYEQWLTTSRKYGKIE